ncbi:MAG: hypothetical protein M3426_05095, partial [Actinomycetota bacterium]|nr:hypothetical protein [Actinomycetota bacterium]
TVEGQTMLRVDDVKAEATLEALRDALDRLDVDYRFARAEPEEDRFPQTAYVYIPDAAADAVENAMRKLSEEHGFDAETL